MADDPQIIVDTFDLEGWPHGLEWLGTKDFGDDLLNGLIADALKVSNDLNRYHSAIRRRVEELGADWYIG